MRILFYRIPLKRPFFSTFCFVRTRNDSTISFDLLGGPIFYIVIHAPTHTHKRRYNTSFLYPVNGNE